MPYSTTVSGLDLGGGVADVRVSAGYAYSVVAGANPGEQRQEEVTLDIPSSSFSSTAPVPFSYAGSLAPQPSPSWFIALWIQEIPRIANDTGWLFRSGRFTSEPPADPIEIILAPESLIGTAELAAAAGALPIVSGATTITAITLGISGAEISIVAMGSNTSLPAGVTFTYSATMTLVPSGSLLDVDSPFEIRLDNASIGFTAGVGTGFVTAVLNLVSGLILNEVSPRIKATLKGRLNAGVLSAVATSLSRGVPSTLPAGVILSVRSVRATTRPMGTGSEAVIGVRAALGAFGGVLNKFPPLVGSGGRCFIATAATEPNSPDVLLLRKWRDSQLLQHRAGRLFVRTYERLSPPLAKAIAGSPRLRAATRLLLVLPAARVAAFLLRRSKEQERTSS